jgi:hypothetical protein
MNRTQKNEIEYVQIDGESIKVRNLRSIRIAKCSHPADSSINILAPT